MGKTIGIVVIGALLYLNLVATYHILRFPHITTTQRGLQLAIAWLIPFVGAVLLTCLHLSDPDYVWSERAKNSGIRNLLSWVTFAGGVGHSDDIPPVHGPAGIESDPYHGGNGGAGDA